MNLSKIEYHTELKTTQIHDLLKNEVKEADHYLMSLLFKSANRPYGKVNHDSFEILLPGKGNRKDVFYPIAYGKLKDTSYGSKVMVTLKPTILATLHGIFTFGFLVYMLFINPFIHHPEYKLTFTPFIFLVMVSTIYYLFFRSRYKKTKEFYSKLFQTTYVDVE